MIADHACTLSLLTLHKFKMGIEENFSVLDQVGLEWYTCPTMINSTIEVSFVLKLWPCGGGLDVEYLTPWGIVVTRACGSDLVHNVTLIHLSSKLSLKEVAPGPCL